MFPYSIYSSIVDLMLIFHSLTVFPYFYSESNHLLAKAIGRALPAYSHIQLSTLIFPILSASLSEVAPEECLSLAEDLSFTFIFFIAVYELQMTLFIVIFFCLILTLCFGFASDTSHLPVV